MSDRIGCGDNSCVFRILRPAIGMATNGGCRCFKNLEHWDEHAGEWNRATVRAVQQNTERLASELRRARESEAALLESMRKTRRHLWRIYAHYSEAEVAKAADSNSGSSLSDYGLALRTLDAAIAKAEGR